MKKSIFFIILNQLLFAQEPTYKLDEIEIDFDKQGVENKKIGKTIKTEKSISKQQVSDTKDLVKYDTGVSVVESGRFGSSGYTIRGVDENRVAIMVDGLSQAQTISSQGFNELFLGYGNFNNTRNGVEVETLREVSIQKGADSVKTGSGALGGSVIFQTKDARDYLNEKDWHFGLKSGYSNKNSESFITSTFAFKIKWFDFLAVKTDRKSKNVKNYGYETYPETAGKRRKKADPYDISKNSTLLKIGVSPNENTRIVFSSDLYDVSSKGHDFSYSFTASNLGTGVVETKNGLRFSDDLVKRKNYSVMIENYGENFLFDYSKITFSNQKIKAKARTDEKCRDGDECSFIENPTKMQVINGKVVDEYGGEFRVEGSGINRKLIDSKGKSYRNFGWEYFGIINSDKIWYDCSIFNCDALEVYEVDYGKPTGNKMLINLNVREVDEKSGKTYGALDFDSSPLSANMSRYAASKYATLLPYSQGYLERQWKDRDLNTDTKQLNLDFEKYVDFLKLSHNIKYGALISQENKSMVNKSGYDGSDAKWWAQPFQGLENGKAVYCGVNFNGFACPYKETSSFLIPVETTTNAFFIGDEFRLNDYISFDLSYRYDMAEHKPKYNPKKSPKIPDDMVKGLFIQPNLKPTNRKDFTNDYWSLSPAQRAEIQRQISENKKYNEQEMKNNAIKNIEYFSQPKKFSNNSYLLGVDFDPFWFARISLKYSKGFRNPTSDELYFTYKHPDFSIIPNWNLSSEIAKTKEFAITLHENIGHISFNIFKTDYKNFIDLEYMGAENFQIGANVQRLDFYKYQNINRQNAQVDGYEIDARLNLGEIHHNLERFYFTLKHTYQKGKFENSNGEKLPINAIDPRKFVYGLSYIFANQKYGFDIYLTDVGEKKAKDTYDMYWEHGGSAGVNLSKQIRHRSGGYRVLDLLAFAKPYKNLTLSFGAYNITNEKYLTWSSARSIRQFGTSNLIDQKTAEGIERFYEPGRNFKFTLEYIF